MEGLGTFQIAVFRTIASLCAVLYRDKMHGKSSYGSSLAMSSSVESTRELNNDKMVSLTLVHAVCTSKRRHDLDRKLLRFKPLPLDAVFC